MHKFLVVQVALSLLAGPVAAQNAAPPRASGTRFREPDPIAFDDHTGFVSIFDGQTLENWVGDPSIWRVENITANLFWVCTTPTRSSWLRLYWV